MASKILFCPTQPPAVMEVVRALTPAGFELIPADVDTPQFYEAAAQAEYYLGFARRMGNDFFRAAPNLKLVQLTSAGYDQVDPEAAKKAKVPVANIVGRAGPGGTLRGEVLDQVKVQAGRVEAGDFQAGAGHTHQLWHVLGGHLAAYVAYLEAEQVPRECDRAVEVTNR